MHKSAVIRSGDSNPTEQVFFGFPLFFSSERRFSWATQRQDVGVDNNDDGDDGRIQIDRTANRRA